MKLIKTHFILFLIIVLAIVLRFVSLSTIPAGFNDDEAAFGYNAYSILKTGHDEWGRLMPFPVFESFGDWKLVGYLYPTVVSIFVFGLSEFAVRFPSAVFGVLTVFAAYLLTKQLFDKKTALIAGLLLAISPWHIVASRNAFESDLLSFFITMGTFFYLKSLREQKYLKFVSLFFAAAFYIYRSAWLFIPLFSTAVSYLNRDKLDHVKKYFLQNAAVFILLLVPLIPVVFTFKGQSRFVQESFITGNARGGITNDINAERGICRQHMSSLMCQAAYNKYTAFVKSYVANYFKNLSYDSFFEKASPTGFQSFATRGVFYLFELPLFISGLIYLFTKKHQSLKILIPWILLAPIGASFTGIGNYGRLNLILPAPQIIEAIGLAGIFSILKSQVLRKTAAASAIFVITFSTLKLWADLFYIEPQITSSYQRYGYKELFNYFESQKAAYNSFFISRKIDNSHQYIQYLFFEKVDPSYFLANVKRSREEDGWVRVEGIGNYFFPSSAPGLESMPPRSLLVTGQKEVTLAAGPIKEIKYLNGDTGFEVYDIDNVKLEQLKSAK